MPRDSVKRGFVEVDLPEAASEVEEIEPTAGRLERLRGRLSRSRSTLGQGLLGLLGAGDLDEDSWNDVEDTLLIADLGAATTVQIVEKLRERDGVARCPHARRRPARVLRTCWSRHCTRRWTARCARCRTPAPPAVVLVVGVNGTGKTTTTGKLARVLVADGRTRAARRGRHLPRRGRRPAADLGRARRRGDRARPRGRRPGLGRVRRRQARASSAGVDAVLIDTAGRLHTKTGLMDELGKVKRVVEKQATVDEVLLVLDATTGQNGLTQARVFAEVVDITGIVLTKLDGTAKGGIVFQVQRELGVPGQARRPR